MKGKSAIVIAFKQYIYTQLRNHVTQRDEVMQVIRRDMSDQISLILETLLI